jgi:hypothetical protein
LIPPDLRDAALARLDHAFRVLGPVELDGILDVDLVWRPLIGALSRHLPLSWTTRGEVDRNWFPADIELVPALEPKLVAADACANPRAEAVEVLRWARELLARGDVPACEVAIAASSTQSYDVYLSARIQIVVRYPAHGAVEQADAVVGQACHRVQHGCDQGCLAPEQRQRTQVLGSESTSRGAVSAAAASRQTRATGEMQRFRVPFGMS